MAWGKILLETFFFTPNCYHNSFPAGRCDVGFKLESDVCYGMSNPFATSTQAAGVEACTEFYDSSLNINATMWCRKQAFLKVSSVDIYSIWKQFALKGIKVTHC